MEIEVTIEKEKTNFKVIYLKAFHAGCPMSPSNKQRNYLALLRRFTSIIILTVIVIVFAIFILDILELAQCFHSLP